MSASEPAEELPPRRAPSGDKVTECRLAPDEPLPLPDGEIISGGKYPQPYPGSPITSTKPTKPNEQIKPNN